jgi:hypothetical protein
VLSACQAPGSSPRARVWTTTAAGYALLSTCAARSSGSPSTSPLLAFNARLFPDGLIAGSAILRVRSASSLVFLESNEDVVMNGVCRRARHLDGGARRSSCAERRSPRAARRRC